MSGVAVVSHLSCVVAFIVVTSILWMHRPTRQQFPLLIASCAATACWASVATLFAAKLIQNYAWVTIAETMNDVVWLICLGYLLKLSQKENKERRHYQAVFYGFAAFILAWSFIGALLPEFGWQPDQSGKYASYTFGAFLAFSILLLALVEQIYRGSAPQRRWGIKMLCVGIGLMYTYEFYMYANALVFGNITSSIWQMRGAVCATLAPLIGLSALHHRKWQAEILPSRAIIFRSTAFVSCGIYLFIMMCVSYCLRQWGGASWGPALQGVFFSGSLVVLFMTLSSTKARQSAKMFISQNFFKFRYDYREEWIKFSTLLSTHEDADDLPQRVIQSLAGMTESTKGILFEKDDKRGYVLKACWNEAFPHQEVVIEEGEFTEYIQQYQRAIELQSRINIVDLPESLKHFNWGWLLVPLLHGNRLHAFVILAYPPVAFFTLNWEVFDLLSMAGRQAAICLVQEQNAQALAIARQFEGYNRLSAFVMHDLKNIQSQLKLINSNKEKHAANPIFVNSVFQTVSHMADKIERLLVQMRARHPRVVDEVIKIERALEKVQQLTRHRQPVPQIEWRDETQHLSVLGDEERLINVLCHLVENAQQATPAEGEVVLSVSLKEDKLLIAIEDTGCGMDPEFLHLSLYKPFVTTKGAKGMGIGVYEAREYLHTIGARLSVESVKNEGSIFKLEFPLNQRSVQQVVA